MNHAIRFLSIFLGVVGIAHAVPTAINYQGRLTDGDGNPASGSKAVLAVSSTTPLRQGTSCTPRRSALIAVDE